MRYLTYLVGTVILAFGITLNTKTQLGVSAIIAVPYSIAEIGGILLGMTLFAFYTFCVLMQWVILRKKFEMYQWSQLIVSVITSYIVDAFDKWIPVVEGNIGIKLVFLAIAIFCTGLGAALTVGMQLIPNPADGFANAVGELFKKDFGFGKNALDFMCLTFSAIYGLIFAHKLVGIHIGTVCAMIFTGRVIALCTKPVNKWFVKIAPNYNVN